MSASDSCVDEGVLVAFVDRSLDEASATPVRRHIAECSACRQVVAELARETPRGDGAPTLPLRRGALLGRYVLAERVGSGGMGVVYAADDPALGRRVALKVLREHDGDEASRRERSRRFEVERRILARLEHPGIARLLDGGETNDGIPFLVMELVSGVPIIEFCDAHHWSVTRRLELFLDVCGAVQFAHEHLVVHRDLKPSNILVTNDGVPRLLDFGIAKLLEQPEGSELLTATGAQVMTPAFASPEQVRGAPITTATDVYALGVILHELLTGTSPYGEPTGLDALLTAVKDHEPARPSLSVTASPERVLARAPTSTPAGRSLVKRSPTTSKASSGTAPSSVSLRSSKETCRRSTNGLALPCARAVIPTRPTPSRNAISRPPGRRSAIPFSSATRKARWPTTRRPWPSFGG